MRGRGALGADRQQDALDAGAEADPRRRRAADRFDQPVVAATAADCVLRSDCLVLELECRAGVVVEATDQRRCELVADTVGIEVLAHALEVLLAGSAEGLPDLRRARKQRLNTLALHVEDPKRRGRALRARFVVELPLVLVEP